MKECRISRWIPAVIIAVALIIGAGAAQAGEFTADVVITMGEKVDTLKIAVKKNYYRLTSVEEGVEKVMMRKRGTTYLIYDDKKQYKECKNENLVNPVAAWENLSYQMQGARDGIDTVQSYPCDRFAFKYKDSENTVFLRWFSSDLNFIIKQKHSEAGMDRTMELVNIKQTELADALFEIPEDYELVE